jgi:hypothetical protein
MLKVSYPEYWDLEQATLIIGLLKDHAQPLCPLVRGSLLGSSVGFYDTLRLAGPVMILAPILGAVGLTLVTISHLIPIAMGYQLVPASIAADPAGQATLAATADTFAAIALVTNAAGNFLGFGVVVPLYAVAILTTRALPRWIGWLGLLVGALAGWLGLLSPASSVISSISNIGFIGFFVFMLSMGIALLRRRSQPDEATQASAPELS